jgi:hypothetical protein
MSEHDDLVTKVGAQDVQFFEQNPDRTYRARPADPLEIWEFRNCYVVDEERHQPAIVVKQFHHNGYYMLTRKLVGAPKGINLYDVSEELVRRVFEPTLH